MTIQDWEDIRAAMRMLEESKVNKIEGNCWKVYRVGKIYRIDIEYPSK